MLKKMNLRTKLILVVAISSLATLALVGVLSCATTSNILKNRIREYLFSESRAVTNELNEFFTRIEQVPVILSGMDETLLTESNHSELLLDQIKRIIESDADLLHIYAAYEPGVADGPDYQFLGYGHEVEGTEASQLIPNLPGTANYDPDLPIDDYRSDGTWYGLAKNEGQVVWGPAHRDIMTGALLATVASPIYLNGEFVGVVAVDITLATLDEVLSKIKVGETGYAFVLAPDGRFLGDPPRPDLVEQGKTLSDLADETGIEDLRVLEDEMIAGNEGIIEVVSPSTGKVTWVSYRPLESTGWLFAVNSPISELLSEINQLILLIILVSLGGLILMGIIAFVFANGIAKPLKLIVNALENVSQGNLHSVTADDDRKKVFARGDELGAAARAVATALYYLRDMGEIANQIADGDLSVEVKPRTERDEFGQTFARMVANMRQLVAQVQENAGHVAAASEQISGASEQAAQATQQVAATSSQVAHGTAEQTRSATQVGAQIEQMAHAIDGIAQGAHEQSRGIERVSATAGQMSTAVMRVASSAQASAQTSEQAARTAQAGANTIRDTVEAIGVIRQTVAQAGQKVEQMQQHSAQIGTIVETIDDIAEQTNLLALNAAIEAARAGEQGRGFAVVADEVRKLAERSGKATKEIAQLIQSVQDGTTEMVSAMDNSLRQVESGSVLSEQAGQALQEILIAVKQTSDQVSQIASAVDEMSAANEELLSGVDAVSAVVEETTASTEELAASSAEIQSAAENVAAVSEENAASVEEVSATAEEVAAQVEEMAASAQSLAAVANELMAASARFRLTQSEVEHPSLMESTNPKPVTQAKVSTEPVQVNGNGHAH